MNEESESSKEKDKKTGRSIKSILGVVLKVFLVLVVGGVIGAVVYFSAVGWVPYLDQRLFEPIEDNKNQIQDFASTQQALEYQLSVLEGRLQETQSIDNLDIESALAAAESELEKLTSAIDSISAYSLTQVPALLETITVNQQRNESHISALATAQLTSQGNEFESELMLIIALLSRTNQFSLHNNYGLAEDQLNYAQFILLEMKERYSGWQRSQVLELISLIEGAIEDLPNQPEVAGVKLELAWQLVLQAIQTTPTPETQGTHTPTPYITITPTPIP